MGQNDHKGNAPDAGNTNSPQLPSQQLVGDSQPHYPSELIGSLKPMNPPPLQLQPAKNSDTSWIIGCSIAAGVVICLCTLTSFALFRLLYDPIVREQDSKATIQNFCLEMRNLDYVIAYNHLSTAAKGRIGTMDQFMNLVATLDRSQGTVTSCVIDMDWLRDEAVDSEGNRMDIYVWVFRGNNSINDPNWSDKSVKITLVFENNAWKVDAVDPTGVLL